MCLKLAKLKELTWLIYSELNADFLAITEHHVAKSEFVDEEYMSVSNSHSLQIKGYCSASKHRQTTSGGVAWYWKRGLNVEIWEGGKLPDDLLSAGLGDAGSKSIVRKVHFAWVWYTCQLNGEKRSTRKNMQHFICFGY